MTGSGEAQVAGLVGDGCPVWWGRVPGLVGDGGQPDCGAVGPDIVLMRHGLTRCRTKEARMLIGGSYLGEGAVAAHMNTVFGERSRPAGVAWARALAIPRAGQAPFVAVVIPAAEPR